MNQEEADRDVADEVSEEVDSTGKVMRSENNDWQFLRRSELVDDVMSARSLTCDLSFTVCDVTNWLRFLTTRN